DYSSVVYWYQEEPHKEFPRFPSIEDRIPFLIPGEKEVAEKHMEICIDFYKKVKTLQGEPQGSFPQRQCLIYILPKISIVRDAFFNGKYDYALKELDELDEYIKQI
ncbi:MAG: hypothetical protein NTX88_03060, partial [Candidatus Atribacteria bacterium]|nr:hypothetical protein [Candidatus Atribacteria bacterium]